MFYDVAQNADVWERVLSGEVEVTDDRHDVYPATYNHITVDLTVITYSWECSAESSQGQTL